VLPESEPPHATSSVHTEMAEARETQRDKTEL